MIARKLLAVPGLTLCTALPCFAAGSGVDINGFLSVGGGMSDVKNRGVDATGAPGPENVVRGYEKDFTFTNDILLGIQLDSQLSEKLSVTGQLVASGDDGYDTEAAWAYFSYDATDNLRLRGGRFRAPFYMYSDYLEVGYAYHFISPPFDVYNIPFDSIDGVDFVYQNYFGDVDASLQVYAGGVDADFELETSTGDFIEIESSIRNSAGIVFTGNYEILTVRASHHITDMTVTNFDDIPLPLVGSVGALRASLVGEGATDAASMLNFDEVGLSFTEFAAKIDWNNFLLIGEYTNLETDNDTVIGNWNRYFVSGGYTFGDWMLHVTYSSTDDEISDIALVAAAQGAAPQNIGLLSSLADTFISTSETVTVGIRYDFDSGAALKAEVAETTDDTDFEATLFRVAVDLVF